MNPSIYINIHLFYELSRRATFSRWLSAQCSCSAWRSEGLPDTGTYPGVCLCMFVFCFLCIYGLLLFYLFCVFVCVYECLQNELDWAKKIEKTCFRNPSKLDPVVKSILWSLIHAADNLVYVKRTRSTILTYMGTYLYSRLIALAVGNFSVTCCHHMLPIWICEAEENSEDVPKVNISRRSLVQN